jgi:hypothetical protein
VGLGSIFDAAADTHVWRQLRAASRTVVLDRTTDCDGDHWNILVFPVRRIFETTVGGSASVGAAEAALDAWRAYR